MALINHCFICRSQQVIQPERPPENQEDFPPEKVPFNFLCKLVNADWALKFRKIPECFCSPCQSKIQIAKETEDEIETLMNKLARLTDELKNLIKSSYNLTSEGQLDDDDIALGKMLSQCWADCEVNVEQIETEGTDSGSNVLPDGPSEDSFDPFIPQVIYQESSNDPEEDPLLRSVTDDEDSDQDSDQNSDQDSEQDSHATDDSVKAPTRKRIKHSISSESSDSSDEEEEGGHQKQKYEKAPEYKCTYCDQTYGRHNHLVMHMRGVHGAGDPKKAECKHCGLNFQEKCMTEDPVTKLPLFQCNSCCTDTFKTLSELRTHHRHGCYEARRAYARPEASKKIYTCKICDKSFNRASHLQKHKKSHKADEKPKRPPKMKKPKETIRSKSQATTKRRVEKSKAEKPAPPDYVCQICGKITHRKNTYKTHMKTHMDNGKCKLCLLEFNSVDASPNGLYTCSSPGCSQSFNNLEDFKTHHIQECRNCLPAPTPCICEVCGVAFKNERNLRRHKKSVHTERSTTKSFICEQCGAGFKTNVNLVKHIEYVHIKEKKFKCEDCDAAFITPCQLKYHRRKHTGPPGYICEVCGKAFYTVQFLKNHVAAIHTKIQAECPQCGKVFQSKQHVAAHITRTHRQAWRKWVATAKEKKMKQIAGTAAGNVNNDHPNPQDQFS